MCRKGSEGANTAGMSSRAVGLRLTHTRLNVTEYVGMVVREKGDVSCCRKKWKSSLGQEPFTTHIHLSRWGMLKIETSEM